MNYNVSKVAKSPITKQCAITSELVASRCESKRVLCALE